MNATYIDLKQLSTRLGVSTRTVRNYVHTVADPLPAYRFGGKLLFDQKEVAEWLEGHRIVPVNLDGLATEILSGIRAGDTDQ